MDKHGNLIKDFTWNMAHDFTPFGVAVVGIGTAMIGCLAHFQGKYGLIDREGNPVKPFEWEGEMVFFETSMSEEGLMPVGIFYDEYTYLVGYANYTGNMVISPRWAFATDFTNGLALVSYQDIWVYRYFHDFYDFYESGRVRYIVIDTTGKEILEIPFDLLNEKRRTHVWMDIFAGKYVRAFVHEGRHPYNIGGKSIFLDLNGNLVPRRSVMGNMSFWANGIFKDNASGKYGIHQNGTVIVAPIFCELRIDDWRWRNVFFARVDDREGLIHVERSPERI